MDENNMMPHPGSWPVDPEAPSPEMLAAYFDGECEGRDDLTLLKQHIEAWLADHPEGQAELAEYRHLRQLWQETTPPEPASSKWAGIQAHLETVANCGKDSWPSQNNKWLRRVGWLGAAAATVACAIMFWPSPEPAPILPQIVQVNPAAPPAEPEEILEVAMASEVSILRVEGADTHTLVVGELPVQGNLELVKDGDVVLTNVQPDADDSMLPEVRMGARSTPFIWARLDTEQDE